MTTPPDIRTQVFVNDGFKVEPGSKTEQSAMTVRYAFDESCPFLPEYLTSDSLHSLGLTAGLARAGRGNTTFFNVAKASLVLRHYYRGGLIRHLSKRHYVYTGLENTRAFREFDLLVHLQEASLPAPRPYACGVKRKALFYTASLITYRLPGSTMASRLQTGGRLAENAELNERLWQAVGRTIAHFHKAGIYHADLNAHNILIDDNDIFVVDQNTNPTVSIIDFDKGEIRSLPAQLATKGWCFDNMQRLERSCLKVVGAAQAEGYSEQTIRKQFNICKSSWVDHLNQA